MTPVAFDSAMTSLKNELHSYVHSFGNCSNNHFSYSHVFYTIIFFFLIMYFFHLFTFQQQENETKTIEKENLPNVALINLYRFCFCGVVIDVFVNFAVVVLVFLFFVLFLLVLKNIEYR